MVVKVGERDVFNSTNATDQSSKYCSYKIMNTEHFYKTETDLQISKTNLFTKGET